MTPILVEDLELRGARDEIVLGEERRRATVSRSESALWMLADMQAVMNGAPHAVNNLVIEGYQLLIRHAILSLSPDNIGSSHALEPWADQESASELQQEGEGYIESYDRVRSDKPQALPDEFASF
ncbi:hypothetical protein FRB98_001843, partial [Tulasnella sp. 332]